MSIDPSSLNHVRLGKDANAMCGHPVTKDYPEKGSTCNECVSLLIKVANRPTWVRQEKP